MFSCHLFLFCCQKFCELISMTSQSMLSIALWFIYIFWLQVPYEETCEDSNCCLCCKDGFYSFKISLPKKGYERRETVQPVIEITNNTQSSVLAKIKFSKVSVCFVVLSTHLFSNLNQINCVVHIHMLVLNFYIQQPP